MGRKNRKNRKDYWYSYDSKAPKGWRFVDYRLYSCSVKVIERNDTIGYMDIVYKITPDRTVDTDYLKEKLFTMFNREVYFEMFSFKRDGGFMEYVSKIRLTANEYKNVLRIQKLKRIIGV